MIYRQAAPGLRINYQKGIAVTINSTVNHHVSADSPVTAYIQATGMPVIQLGEAIHIFASRYPDTLTESAEFVRRLVLAGEELLEQIELRLQAEQPSEVCS